MRQYFFGLWSATSQLVNAIIGGHPNESLSGRCYGEPWPRLMAIVNKLFFWQVNHCRSAFTNDLKWAKKYVARAKERGHE